MLGGRTLKYITTKSNTTKHNINQKKPKNIMKRYLFYFLAFALSFSVASCDDTPTDEGVPEPTIEITQPETLTYTIGETGVKLVAAVENSDVSVQWSSSNAEVVAVGVSTGVLTFIAEGTATITAKCGEVSDEIEITVEAAPVVDKPTITIALPDDGSNGVYALSAGSVTLTATTENGADDDVVTWYSNQPSIVSVDKDGKLTFKKIGKANITAIYAKESSNTIGIEVVDKITDPSINIETPAKTTYTVGDESVTLTATKANVEGDIVWSSSKPDVVAVDGGVLTFKAEGTATITATCGEVSDDVEIIVEPKPAPTIAIALPDEAATSYIVESASVTITATTENGEGDVVWSSSDDEVVSVDGGVLTFLKEGTAKITATYSGVTSNEITITVTPKPTISIALTTLEYTVGDTAATIDVTKANGEGDVTWSSTADDVVAVANGSLTFLKAGTATITATYSGVTSNEITITVKAAPSISIAITGDITTYKVGDTGITITPTAANGEGDVVWSSSAADVVSVSGGALTFLKEGTAKITATYSGVTSNEIEITVVPADAPTISIALPDGAATSYKVGAASATITATAENGTGDIVWSSSADDVVSVDGGVISFLKAGTATITATYSGVTSNEITITVVAPTISIALPDGAATSYKVGAASVTITATAENGDGDVVWSSSADDIVSVDGGVLTFIKAGTAKISATYDGVTSNEIEITVLPLDYSTTEDIDTNIVEW